MINHNRGHNTQLNMVIGYPLTHTLSPILHNSVYHLLNRNAVMLANSNPNLASVMQALKALSVGLIAVTMPFKREVLSYVDNESDEVKQLKAANTLILHDGKWFGYNTDIDGIAYALRNTSLANKKVLMIGAGGAAYAAAFYLKKNNADLFWLNRTPKHVDSIINKFGGTRVGNDCIDDLAIDIIINATPVGMFPNMNNSPLPNYQFKQNQTIFDMVYNPLDTMLIQQAKSHGAFCISGLDMFIAQGIKQIELWLNEKIDRDEIIKLVKADLEQTINKSRGTI